MKQIEDDDGLDLKSVSKARAAKVTFADGTSYHFSGDSAIDLVLSPTFLKFFLICLLIFSVLQERSDLAALGAWEKTAVWLTISATAAVWLIISVYTAIFLWKRNLINSVYTPFISVTILAVTEPMVQIMLRYVFDVPPSYGYVNLQYFLQPLVALFLMDMLFGNFVAPVHPLFVRASSRNLVQPRVIAREPGMGLADDRKLPEVGPVSEEKDQIETENHSPDAQPPIARRPQASLATLDLNGQKVNVNDILMMQIEDHYLRIDTTNRHIMTRYKMSTAVSEIDPDLGIQINRSVWVAKHAIERVCRTPSYGAEVLLKKGDEFSVSRSRISGVLDACGRWNLEVGRRD